MTQNKPFILISNDDGYHSPGIRTLVDMVSGIGDVLVRVIRALSRLPRPCGLSAGAT